MTNPRIGDTLFPLTAFEQKIELLKLKYEAVTGMKPNVIHTHPATHHMLQHLADKHNPFWRDLCLGVMYFCRLPVDWNLDIPRDRIYVTHVESKGGEEDI